ncbi:MAG: hypothetical protein JXQ75_22925, partial [Phycisphaerae bacterium]|nr:hypothetical protein [Phycisphaerae bacterium]
DKLQEWLSGRHHADGRPMTRLDSTTDAQAVIELLKVVLTRTHRPGGGDRSGTSDLERGQADRVAPEPSGAAIGRQ